MMTRLEGALREDVEGLAGRFDPDPPHAAQVSRLALALFDGLRRLHTLGDRERLLLEVSAMLHDIGWSRTETKGHNKHSRDMILESELRGLTEPERRVAALVARYHRKAEPDASRHEDFASLGESHREIVEWLAAVLRVADGLDRSHRGAVRDISCEIGPDGIVLHLAGSGIGEEDLDGARLKSSLLERKTRRRIEYRPC